MGHTEVADLLQQTLDEEKETDEILTSIGVEINEMCAHEAHGDSSAKTKSSRNN